jgi:hypothetical protein
MTGTERTHSTTRKPADQRTPDTPAPDSLEQETPLPSLAQQMRLDQRLLTPAGILQLQRTIGNVATNQILRGNSVPFIQRMNGTGTGGSKKQTGKGKGTSKKEQDAEIEKLMASLGLSDSPTDKSSSGQSKKPKKQTKPPASQPKKESEEEKEFKRLRSIKVNNIPDKVLQDLIHRFVLDGTISQIRLRIIDDYAYDKSNNYKLTNITSVCLIDILLPGRISDEVLTQMILNEGKLSDVICTQIVQQHAGTATSGKLLTLLGVLPPNKLQQDVVVDIIFEHGFEKAWVELIDRAQHLDMDELIQLLKAHPADFASLDNNFDDLEKAEEDHQIGFTGQTLHRVIEFLDQAGLNQAEPATILAIVNAEKYLKNVDVDTLVRVLTCNLAQTPLYLQNLTRAIDNPGIVTWANRNGDFNNGNVIENFGGANVYVPDTVDGLRLTNHVIAHMFNPRDAQHAIKSSDIRAMHQHYSGQELRNGNLCNMYLALGKTMVTNLTDTAIITIYRN